MEKLAKAITSIESEGVGPLLEHKVEVKCQNVSEVFLVKSALDASEVLVFLKEALVDLEGWDRNWENSSSDSEEEPSSKSSKSE